MELPIPSNLTDRHRYGFLFAGNLFASSVRFEVFTAVIMKNGVFWDIKLSSYFTGDKLHLHYRVQPVKAM
jgi:hypothetical protein